MTSLGGVGMQSTEALLLEDCAVAPEALAGVLERLRRFVARYEPRFLRREQRELGRLFLEGLVSPLKRKSVEPIANLQGVPRQRLQHFVGSGRWDDDALMGELRRHVSEVLGDPEGVIVIDPSGFPKRGRSSVGVARQYCGQTGKTDNCQVGQFLGYVTTKGRALVHRRLYLPKDWAADVERRERCRVPEEVEFRTTWQLADEWLLAHGHEFPHQWVLGDEEFGKSGAFRGALARRGERYLFQIQSRRTVRVLGSRRRAARKRRAGRRREREPFRQAGEWARSLPDNAWRRMYVRDGAKGRLEVQAVKRFVQTRTEGRIHRDLEALVVTRTVDEKPEYRFWLSNDPDDTPLVDMVETAAKRQWIEHDFKRGKGQVGLGQYEVRSWVGWHHHMTLALLALFFLELERLTLA
jgi:SRSO17 transposase